MLPSELWKLYKKSSIPIELQTPEEARDCIMKLVIPHPPGNLAIHSSTDTDNSVLPAELVTMAIQEKSPPLQSEQQPVPDITQLAKPVSELFPLGSAFSLYKKPEIRPSDEMPNVNRAGSSNSFHIDHSHLPLQIQMRTNMAINAVGPLLGEQINVQLPESSIAPWIRIRAGSVWKTPPSKETGTNATASSTDK